MENNRVDVVDVDVVVIADVHDQKKEPVTDESVSVPRNADADDALPTIKEVDEEENFVMTALLSASEEGNVDGIGELLEKTPNFDINQVNKEGVTAVHMAASGGHVKVIQLLHERNINLDTQDKHGDTAVYWAARQGHVEVIKYLKENGVCLNVQNKTGEAAIHVAARYGHGDVLEYLCSSGANINQQDQLGETALHTAAWHGLPPHLCELLCAAGSRVDSKNKDEETPLHCAAVRGNADCVRVLISHGASLNITDKHQATPLHLACRRRHMPVALLLVHTNCNLDMQDALGETPLHSACREGLLPVVQTMCAFGCQVDVVNRAGSMPLHLAARAGQTEVVRCLLLSGSEPELTNKEGITAEILALAQGHNSVAELLIKMKPDKREAFIRQLIPTNQPLNRIKVKVFGNTGSGKSVLIESLKCGYFSSLFRKSRSSMTPPAVKANGAELKKQDSESSQLSYEVSNEAYTQGIDIQQVALNNAGDLSVWEFSGYQPYYLVYDHFIGDPNCVHVVTFSLTDSQEDQLSQLHFWFNFIKARIAPMEPVGRGGAHPWPPHLVLVATHADLLTCPRNSQGLLTSPEATLLFETMCTKYCADFYIYKSVFVLDSHQAMSADMKALRAAIAEMKSHILKCLPKTNGFLDATVAALPLWRKVLASYPVVTWPAFIDYVRSKVNLLASEEHFKELMCQLQLVGEVVYVETDTEQDLVVLHPTWLCHDVFGHLLSLDNLSNSRPTGCFSADDVQLMFPEADAKQLLQLLEAMELCTCCEVDGDLEYEFPAINFTETIPGLWDKQETTKVYGGLRLMCQSPGQLVYLFPRLQVRLRGDMIENNNGPEWDLYQWHLGSKMCHGSLEALLTLTSGGQGVEIKVRGEGSMELFHFRRHILDLVMDVLEDSCPGMPLHCDYLSPQDLRDHSAKTSVFTPQQLITMQIESDKSNKETFVDIVCLGADEILQELTLGAKLHVSHLSIHSRRLVAAMLDPPDKMGRDWCMLAVSLGLTDSLPHLDQSPARRVSKTDSILAMWSRDTAATIEQLLVKLRELGRPDVSDSLMSSLPLYRYSANKHTPRSSDNTLSSSSISR